jgi:hypothetical protein
LRTAECFAVPKTPAKVFQALAVFHCVGGLGEERPLWEEKSVRHGSALSYRERGWTYHAKEVLDATGVDGMQRGHFDAQQRVFRSERHAG